MGALKLEQIHLVTKKSGKYSFIKKAIKISLGLFGVFLLIGFIQVGIDVYHQDNAHAEYRKASAITEAKCKSGEYNSGWLDKLFCG